MKKIMFFITAIMLMIIPSVSAIGYGKVTDITETTGDSLSSGKGTIETKGDTTTIRYSAATFKMLDADESAADGDRPGPAAWIGFEVTTPTDDSDSSFKVTAPDNKTTQVKGSSFRDYVGITPSNLKKVLLNGTTLTYKYSFDWDENGTADQYVIIQIDPKGLTLLSKDNEEEWSPDIAQDVLDKENPKTSDINLGLILGLIVFSGCGLVYYFKKA